MNELFALADPLEAHFNAAKTFFNRLPAAILARAFRGELVPQDEGDESAAVLLHRLRDAQKSAVAPKTGRKARPRIEKQGSLF